jgi:hypothetical protein
MQNMIQNRLFFCSILLITVLYGCIPATKTIPPLKANWVGVKNVTLIGFPIMHNGKTWDVDSVGSNPDVFLEIQEGSYSLFRTDAACQNKDLSIFKLPISLLRTRCSSDTLKNSLGLTNLNSTYKFYVFDKDSTNDGSLDTLGVLSIVPSSFLATKPASVVYSDSSLVIKVDFVWIQSKE